jgi:prolycopene isomerase
MSFYKDHYDVVIIGGALAGMSACLQLQAWGVKDILILEKHNMPGGLATDFVRNGFEIEATLHEMMSIGQPGKRLKVGKFFDDMGVNIDWLPVGECYRVVLPNSGIDKLLHDGYETMAHEIDEVVPGTYDKIHELMLLCRRVYDSMNILSVTPMSKAQMLLKHPDFVFPDLRYERVRNRIMAFGHPVIMAYRNAESVYRNIKNGNGDYVRSRLSKIIKLKQGTYKEK